MYAGRLLFIVEAGDHNARSETCSKSEVNIGCFAFRRLRSADYSESCTHRNSFVGTLRLPSHTPRQHPLQQTPETLNSVRVCLAYDVDFLRVIDPVMLEILAHPLHTVVNNVVICEDGALVQHLLSLRFAVAVVLAVAVRTSVGAQTQTTVFPIGAYISHPN